MATFIRKKSSWTLIHDMMLMMMMVKIVMILCCSAVDELLLLSVCVRGENYTQEAGIAVTLADRSVMCLATRDLVVSNGSFSIGLTVTHETRVWPLEVVICSVSDLVNPWSCITNTIQLPDMQAATSGEASVQAILHSKNATHILYKAHLDYCNGENKPVDGKSKSLIWPRFRTVKRLRRDLVCIYDFQNTKIVMFPDTQNRKYKIFTRWHLCGRDSATVFFKIS